MKNLTMENMAEACGGQLVICTGKEQDCKSVEAACVVIDSRKIEKNGVFIATKGERVNGHRFIPQVAEEGALGVICEEVPENCEISYILVKDSFQALKDIAEYYRQQLSITVVGITGSVGKTSTKEFIASVLEQKYCVCKTQGNFNNEVGLPLTVLSIRDEHQIAVLEMGISNFGEMRRLTKIAKPDICVITNIGQCHLENLGTQQGILKAKSEIFESMNPEGYVFLNGEDALLNTVKKPGIHEIIRFGYDDRKDIYATDIQNHGLFGSVMNIHAGDNCFTAKVPLPGTHMLLNALAATGVGIQLGLSTEEIARGIEAVSAVAGRSNVIKAKNYTVIDDCYNANPVSMKAAIDLLGMALERKVAILGDMFELGEREEALHGDVGAYAAAHGVDELICIGELSRNMYEKAIEACKEQNRETGWISYFKTKEEALLELPQILHVGDAVLVKASHGMHFEEIVAWLQNH